MANVKHYVGHRYTLDGKLKIVKSWGVDVSDETMIKEARKLYKKLKAQCVQNPRPEIDGCAQDFTSDE